MEKVTVVTTAQESGQPAPLTFWGYLKKRPFRRLAGFILLPTILTMGASYLDLIVGYPLLLGFLYLGYKVETTPALKKRYDFVNRHAGSLALGLIALFVIAVILTGGI